VAHIRDKSAVTDQLEGRIVRFALRQGFITAEQAQEGLSRLGERSIDCLAEDLLLELGWIDEAQREELRQRRARSTAKASGKATQIADFQIIREIGQGAMGTVYLARQKRMDRMVAIKVLSEEHVRDAHYVKRFLREAKSSGKINHENIVSGIDVGKWKGTYYFAQEYVDGTAVDELICQLGTLDETASLKIILKIARALEHLIQHGLVHRDIKPENIMLTQEGLVKLCDFGLAKDMSKSAMTSVGTSVGTPHYISPEQARGEDNIDIRADVYSLGVAFYHMLGGNPPFDSGTPYEIMVNHIKKPFPPLDRVAIGNSTRELLGLMVTKSRDRRLSPSQLIKRLGKLVEEGPVVPSLVTAGREAGRLQETSAHETLQKRKPTSRQAAATRHRTRATAKAVRKPRQNSRFSLWLGLALVGVLLVANVIYLTTRGGTDDGNSGEPKEPAKKAAAPGPRPKQPTEAEAAFAAIGRQQAKVDPAKPGQLRRVIELLEQLEQFAVRYKTAPQAQQALTRAKSLRARAEQAVVKRWQDKLTRAQRQLADKQEYAGIQTMREIPGEILFLPFGVKVARLRLLLASAMNQRFARAQSAATKALQAPSKSAIESALEGLSGVHKYGSPAQEKSAEKLRQALVGAEKKLDELARQALADKYELAFQQQVLPAWRKREHARAEQKLVAMQADTSWGEVRTLISRDLAQTRRLATHTASIEPLITSQLGQVVSFRGLPAKITKVKQGVVWLKRKTRSKLAISDFWAEDIGYWLEQGVYDRAQGAGSLSLALFYYAEGELALAEAHLERAVGQGVADAGLAARISAAKPSDPEYAAHQAYRELLSQLEGKQPRAALALIDGFVKTHGKTRTYAHKQAEIAKLRASLRARIKGGDPKKPDKQGPEKIEPKAEQRQVALKGRRIGRRRTDGWHEVLYRFKKPSEAEDWDDEKRGTWGYRQGGLVGGPGGALVWHPEIHGDFRLTLKFRARQGTDDLALVLRSVEAPEKGYRLVIKASGSQLKMAGYAGKSVLSRLDPEAVELDATTLPERITKTTEHRIELRRQGGRFWVKLDGKPLLTGRDTTYGPLKFAVHTFYTAEPRTTRISYFHYAGLLREPKKK